MQTPGQIIFYLQTFDIKQANNCFSQILNYNEQMTFQRNYSFTGFPSCDQKKCENFKLFLDSMGFKFIEKLSQTTNILITNKTCTQKFKIAKLHKTPITCVNKQWVQDSIKKNVIQSIYNYLITQKEMFFGVTVAICGFSPETTQKIQKIIQDRKGQTITKYKAFDLIRKYDDIPEEVDVILASQDEIERAKFARLPSEQQHIPSLVRLQWLEDSLKRNRCKYPSDYAVNFRAPEGNIRNVSRLTSRFELLMKNDVMDKSGDFLQNTVIYIDKQIRVDTARVYKNLISICGGYWTDKFCSVVTHVIVESIEEERYMQYKKYGSRIHIVRSGWIIDSILLYNKLDEQDFMVRIFKVSDQIIRNMIQEDLNRKQKNNQNSQNFNSMPFLGERRMSTNSNTFPFSPPMQTGKKKKSNNVKINVFNERFFYFPQELMTDKYYHELSQTIRNAGGLIYKTINSKMSAFVILRDSPQNIQIKNKIHASKHRVVFRSDRWIKQCIKKGIFIEPDTSIYYVFRPFDFFTPLPDFHKHVFEVVGYNMLQIARIRQLLSVLGSTKTNPNKADLTHVLCGPNWNSKNQIDKINKILSENKKAQFIAVEWLSECMNEKKVIDTDKFLLKMSESQSMQTPEKKNQSSSDEVFDKKGLQTSIDTLNKSSP